MEPSLRVGNALHIREFARKAAHVCSPSAICRSPKTNFSKRTRRARHSSPQVAFEFDHTRSRPVSKKRTNTVSCVAIHGLWGFARRQTNSMISRVSRKASNFQNERNFKKQYKLLARFPAFRVDGLHGESRIHGENKRGKDGVIGKTWFKQERVSRTNPR